MTACNPDVQECVEECGRADEPEQRTLADWQHMGIGPVSTDLAVLVAPPPPATGTHPNEQLDNIEPDILATTLPGLRTAVRFSPKRGVRRACSRCSPAASASNSNRCLETSHRRPRQGSNHAYDASLAFGVAFFLASSSAQVRASGRVPNTWERTRPVGFCQTADHRAQRRSERMTRPRYGPKRRSCPPPLLRSREYLASPLLAARFECLQAYPEADVRVPPTVTGISPGRPSKSPLAVTESPHEWPSGVPQRRS